MAQACLDQEYPNCARMEWDKPWPPLPACPVPLDDAERPIVVKMAATRLDSSRERIAGLRLLLESDPESGLNVLRGALGSERDTAVRALLRHLIGLYRDATTADVLRHYLDDPDAGVRAAAADAIGLIHCPAYTRPALPSSCSQSAGRHAAGRSSRRAWLVHVFRRRYAKVGQTATRQWSYRVTR